MTTTNYHSMCRIQRWLALAIVSLLASEFAISAADPGLDANARAAEAEQFAKESPESLGQNALESIERGLQDPDRNVVIQYVYALQRVGRAHGLSRPSAAGPAAVTVSNGLKAHVRSLVSKADRELAYQAAVSLALITEHDRDLEQFLLATALSPARLPADASMLIALISRPAPLTEEMRTWLIRTVSSGTYTNAESAALAFRRFEDMPEELLPALVSRLRDKSNFANINLLKLIRRYGLRAEPYAAELGSLETQLRREAGLSPSQRSVQVFNADRTLKLLSELNASLRAG